MQPDWPVLMIFTVIIITILILLLSRNQMDKLDLMEKINEDEDVAISAEHKNEFGVIDSFIHTFSITQI